MQPIKQIEHDIKEIIDTCDQLIHAEKFDDLINFYTEDAILVIKPEMIARGREQTPAQAPAGTRPDRACAAARWALAMRRAARVPPASGGSSVPRWRHRAPSPRTACGCAAYAPADELPRRGRTRRTQAGRRRCFSAPPRFRRAARRGPRRCPWRAAGHKPGTRWAPRGNGDPLGPRIRPRTPYTCGTAPWWCS